MFKFYEEDFTPFELIHKLLTKPNLENIMGYAKELISPQSVVLNETSEVLVEHLDGYGTNTSPKSIIFCHNVFQAVSAISFALCRRGSNLLKMAPDYRKRPVFIIY